MFQHHITVAEAAAILNVVIVIVQITYPLLITLVAVGVVKNRTNVATWSVFGRLINNSYWPVLLQTDTVGSSKVDKRVRGIALSSWLTTLLLAIAAVVTPLGLHSKLRTNELDNVRFEYSRDASAVGLAQQPRAGYNSSRTCTSGFFNCPCPGNDDGVEVYSNSTGDGVRTKPGRDDGFITTTVPQNTSDVFRSADAANGGTVANIFDIQYRSFLTYNNQTVPNPDQAFVWVDHGKPRTQGKFQYYQQFLLENKTRAIEGLIISTQGTPGIGLRNHTLPPSSEYGYTWTEKVLWLQPETECTSLNLTYEYMIPPPSGSNYALNQSVVDRGGFVDIPAIVPILDLNDTQSDPRYLNRSTNAAMLTNVFLAKYLNLTRSKFKLNARYALGDYQDPKSFVSYNTSAPAPDRLAFSSFGTLDLTNNASNPSLPGSALYTLGSRSTFTGRNDEVVNIDPLVTGMYSGDSAQITLAGAAGGLMLGTGSQIDDNGNALPDGDAAQLVPGSMWSQPIFACVSGVAATIMEVTYQLNGTSSLDNLVIQSVEPVKYASDDDLPVWAMENIGKSTISGVSPYWGIISKDAITPGVSTVRQAKFRLPPSSPLFLSGYALSTVDDAIAGAKAPLAAMTDIYNSVDDYVRGSQDYTGGNNYLLYRQWHRLLSNSSTAGNVINLIWTDLMANYIVSARSTLSDVPGGGLRRHDDSSAPYATRSASQFSMGITYDWRYAIPALVFVCVYAGLLAWALIMFITRGLSIATLRFLLNQTAAGRSVTTERYQATSDLDVTRTEVWARVRGDEIVRVGKDMVGVQHFGGPGSQEYHPLESKPGMQHSAVHGSQ